MCSIPQVTSLDQITKAKASPTGNIVGNGLNGIVPVYSVSLLNPIVLGALDHEKGADVHNL